MLSSTYFLWDSEYPLYVYIYIFIVILIIWEVRQNYSRFKWEQKRSCCRRHRKVRKRARDAATRARRLCQEEAEKPWELLSIMKSQSWLPKEEHVRQLLCVDPCCQICDAATLEIQQLLESEQSQISPALLELPQGSSSLEMLPISSASFEQNVELHSRHSTDFPLAPVTQTLTEHLTQSTSTVGVQQCCADHLLAGQGFHQADMPMIFETAASLRLREPAVLVNAEEMMHSDLSYNYVQQIQDHPSFNSQTPFQTLNPDSIHVTHPMALSLVTTVPPPFLNPEVVRLLELHVKKLMHFQRWGLPRRVEESLRQLMPNPPMYFQLENNQPVSLLLNNPSRDYAHRFGSLPPETWCSFTDNQPTQTFWVSQWSNVELEQKAPCGQMTSPVKKFLFSRDHDILRGIWLLPEGQANNSRDKLQKTFTQLFCGLPSIHSESLVETFLGTRGLSKDTSEPSCKDPYLLKEASPFFLPPHVPPTAAPPPSSASPNKSLYECQAQINVPCLTLAECKTLEWHLLQRQLQLQWGLPAVIPGSPYEQSPIQYKPCNKAKPHETLKASWPGKSFSVLTRDLVFIPEHTRRLLEFHLQKQLIHLRWGLPQRIQRSIHLVLSSPGQQPRSCSSRALPNVSILQPGDPEADGSGDTFAVAVERGSFHTPHLFGQAKAMLKTHVDSKCGQIHQGKVPAYVQSSWECRIPRSLAVEASISSQHLELQAKNSPDLHHKAVSQEPEPAALDQEKQALSGTLTEHCKRPQTLSEETIKKLETMLRHKYLAFLSGLPVHYCVTPSRATSPATVSQSTNTEIMLGPVKPQEPLTQETLQEDPYWSRLEPCTQGENEASADIARDDNETSEDIAGEIQPKVQVAGGTEKVSLETQTQILAKLSFHLKKKILEIKLGIPIIANELKKSNVVDPESEYTQGPVGTLSIPESTALPQLLNSGNSPPVPDANRVLVGKQPATAWQAVCHKQNQPSSKAAPHDSAQWGSKASQLRNMVEAQVHCVQLETSGEKPNLEKTFNSEPQSPGKSEYSAHVPTLTEKSNESGKPESGKPKAVGDLEKGGARLGLSPASGKTHRDGDEEPEKRLPPETPQGSSEQRSLHLEVLCLPSPQDPSEFEFPDPPPEVLMETDDAQNIQDSLTKVDAVPEPARIAKLTQPVASKTYQGLPFPRPPTQGKPFRGQAWQDHISQRQMMPASPHASPSLPEAGLKNKMKSFLHSMSPKIKDKTHMEPTVSTSGKVSKPSKENVDKGLPQAKSPTKKTKTENCRGPKAQPASSERPVIASVLTAPHNLDSKLGPRSRQHGSVSVPGQPRHCPRHCPRLARATQYRNPP